MSYPTAFFNDAMHINTSSLQLTDDEFVRFCEDNPDLRVERTEDKIIVIMSPNYTKTGFYHGIIIGRLVAWNSDAGQGLIFDSSAGFFLADGSVRMPDASWVSNHAWNAIPSADREKYIHLCPDFVVEVKSKTDRLPDLQQKMEAWIKNGCRLAWLIDPEAEKVLLYKKNSVVREISGFDNTLSGEDILNGFSFKLSDLRLD